MKKPAAISSSAEPAPARNRSIAPSPVQVKLAKRQKESRSDECRPMDQRPVSRWRSMRSIRAGEPCRSSVAGPRSTSRRASAASMPSGRSGCGQFGRPRPAARGRERRRAPRRLGAVPGEIDQRPALAGRARPVSSTAEQPGRIAKQQAAPRRAHSRRSASPLERPVAEQAPPSPPPSPRARRR